MPPRKGKLIVFPSRPTETSLEPPPAAPQVATRQVHEITRSVAQNCLPGVRRRLFLQWVGSDEHSLNVEYEMARNSGVSTRVLMRMLRAETKILHQKLFFSRKAA